MATAPTTCCGRIRRLRARTFSPASTMPLHWPKSRSRRLIIWRSLHEDFRGREHPERHDTFRVKHAEVRRASGHGSVRLADAMASEIVGGLVASKFVALMPELRRW